MDFSLITHKFLLDDNNGERLCRPSAAKQFERENKLLLLLMDDFTLIL
jgi:hypothetical protein